MKRNMHLWTIRPSYIGTSIRSLLLSALSPAAAAPSLAFPINSQVPPIARVSTPFQFVFSPSTFTSGSTTIQYTLANAPLWLQLDSATRTLFGTPKEQDIGPLSLNLVATDDSGSTTAPVTLVVSSDAGPGLGAPIEQQILAFGVTSGPGDLLLYPGSSLSISFGSDTFTNVNADTQYYATCANNTPLPSWITFNAQSISFTGTAPSVNSPTELPQDVGIRLIASDVAGFSGAVATFHIIVEEHELTFGNATLTINVIPGKVVAYDGLQTALTLDGNPLEISDIQEVHAEAPEWLSVNGLVLSGSPPAGLMPQNFTVSVIDVHGDVATTVVLISVGSPLPLISGTIGTIEAIIGSVFEYTFGSSRFLNTTLQLSINLGNTSSWLRFDPTTLTLSGTVPSGYTPQRDQLNLTASQGSDSQSQLFFLSLIEGDVASGTCAGAKACGTTTLSAAPSSASTPGPTLQVGASEIRDASSRAAIIAVAVIVPFVALVSLLLLIVYCRGKRRQSQRPGGMFGLEKRSISRPGPLHQTTYVEREGLLTEKGLPSPTHKRLPSVPPKIDIPPALFSGGDGRSSPSAPPQHGLRKNSRASRHESFQELVRRSLYPSAFGGHHRSELVTAPEFSIQDDNVPLRRPDMTYKPRDRLSSNRRFSQRVLFSPSRSSYHPQLNSAMSPSSPSGLSHRLSGIGHGSSIFDLYGPRRYSRLQASPPDKSEAHGLGHGNRPPSGPSGFGIVTKSWRNTASSEEWTSTNSSSEYPFPYPPPNQQRSLRSLSSTSPPSRETSPNAIAKPAPISIRTTIRPVTTPMKVYTAPSAPTDRDRYLKARRRNPSSAFFAAGPSTRKSIPPSSPPSEPLPVLHPPHPGADKENSHGRSRSPTSAQRKGKMMQRSYSASSSLQPPPSVSAARKIRTVLPPVRNEGPPQVARRLFQRASHDSLGSSRFESAIESEFEGCGLAEELEETLEESLLDQVESGGESGRLWKHGGLPNPLGVHGNEATGRAQRSSRTRDGSEWSEEGKAVLGGGGKPASTESAGRRGGTRGDLAFV